MALANSKGHEKGLGNETLWYFGGEARTSSGQDSNTWTNALVSLTLEDDWQTGTPPLQLVQADTGNYSAPPAVTLGALWASADGNTLYQYGGSFSDSPSVPPPVQRTFAYDIQGDRWSVAETSRDIGNVAEGQPALVPGQGTDGENVGYYSHGHQDDHTTSQWSNQIDRIYLNSMVQFDMGDQKFSNITSYSSAAKTSNTSTALTNPVSRADGTLTYVPNLGTDGKGILVSIGGATETQYVDNSVLDVYDIGAQGWTRQATTGTTMGRRVNHCSVRGSAKVDGVQVHHIFSYGGQALNQTERDSAMYILTIKEDTYTWSFVGDALPGQPTGRAGHQCALQGSQMIVMGGLTRDDVICEQPGIFVYNTSSSSWQSSYQANTVFTTPTLLANITGGIGTGYSTSGAGSASGGDGSSDPDTSGSNRGGGGGSSRSSGDSGGGGGGGGTSIGAIVGGVVGGVLGLALLALIAFWLVRRKKREREDARTAEKSRLAGRSDSGSQQNSIGSEFPSSSMYDMRRMSAGQVEPAHDDVEDEMLGRDIYIASGMAPRRELRVVNADGD
ncbi:hypothetical protein JCM10213v2_007198 [Rhodosporidiobolus nylandii]